MVFYPGAELKHDPSSWWGPNRICVEAMLRDVGFKQITYTPSRSQGN
jgi:tRNA (mo5U34)-methyltransferase